MDKRELEELKETVVELSEWRIKLEATQEAQQKEKKIWIVRCWAGIGLIWGAIIGLGGWAVDNIEIIRAMAEAGIKAKLGK